MILNKTQNRIGDHSHQKLILRPNSLDFLSQEIDLKAGELEEIIILLGQIFKPPLEVLIGIEKM